MSFSVANLISLLVTPNEELTCKLKTILNLSFKFLLEYGTKGLYLFMVFVVLLFCFCLLSLFSVNTKTNMTEDLIVSVFTHIVL